MKAATVVLGALAAAVVAQDINSLPSCARLCVNNMLAANKAKELGCAQGDNRCLCTKGEFTYGIHDCSSDVCKSDHEAINQAVQYGQSICSKAGVSIQTNGGNGSASGTATADNTATATGTGGNGSDGVVSTIYSVETSGATTFSTAIATTTLGAGVGGSGTATDTGAGVMVTTFTSSGSQIVQTVATSAASTADSSTAANGASSSSSSHGATSTGGAAPYQTAAPVGLFAAAGLAVLLL